MEPNICEQLKFLTEFFQITYDYDAQDMFWWKIDNNQVRIFVNCNDLFWWATGDNEEVTPNNINLLRNSFEECRKIGHQFYGDSYFACRVRQMRPMDVMLNKMKPELKALFESVGPKRENNMCNPRVKK